MPCILRVSGKALSLDVLSEIFPIEAYRTWRKGEPRVPGSRKSKIHNDFGACFDVSTAGFDEFAKQQEDAILFLISNRSSLRRMTSFPDVEYAQLDFGIDWGGSWLHTDVLSAAFLRAAADTGISVAISHYRHSEDETVNQ